MQTGYKHQNMINQLVKWLSFVKASVNIRFIAALRFKVDNSITLDVPLNSKSIAVSSRKQKTVQKLEQ